MARRPPAKETRDVRLANEGHGVSLPRTLRGRSRRDPSGHSALPESHLLVRVLPPLVRGDLRTRAAVQPGRVPRRDAARRLDAGERAGRAGADDATAAAGAPHTAVAALMARVVEIRPQRPNCRCSRRAVAEARSARNCWIARS